MKLLAYKFIKFVPFGDGEYYSSYQLTVLKSSFFGLRKKEQVLEVRISMFVALRELEEKWDKIILEQTPFKP